MGAETRNPGAGDAGARDDLAGGLDHGENTRTPDRLQAIRETAEDYPRVIARVSEQWRVILCREGIQWIAQRRDPNGTRWRSISFFRTSHWLRELCKDLCTDPAAWRTLERLPDNVSERERTRPERREDVSGAGRPEKAPAAVATRVPKAEVAG